MKDLISFTRNLILILSLFLIITEIARPADPVFEKNNENIYDTVPFSDNLFSSNKLIEFDLRFDITRFMQEKPDEGYLDGIVTVFTVGRDSVNTPVRIRARGNFRYRECSFPPIRINLKKSGAEGELISDVSNLKMVTNCNPDDKYESYLLKEYLVYRIYNILNEFSFRVRLLKVNYIDTGTGGNSFSRYAFFIEPMEMILDRFSASEVTDEELSYDKLVQGLYDRISLFEFMIGNCDWFISIVKNFRLIQSDKIDPDRIIAIPYDFDYSGFVNADYSVPRTDLGLETIRDRAYLGPCRSEEEYRLMLEEFMLHRKEILKLIRKFSYLDWVERTDIKNYVKDFYSLYKKDKIIQMMNNNCIKTNQ